MLTEVEGDLIRLARDGRFDVIVHGCNCFCEMGAGIARLIRSEFPEAYEADLATEKGDLSKLGTCSEAFSGGVVVVNAYTQYHFRGKGVLVDYDALREALRWVRQCHGGKRIGLPRIGAGLAKGDWEIIQRIIEEELGAEDATLVNYQPVPD
jgi:O-acetyl-ADP-ribose deacetylase (regulator of RNase III)